MRLLKNESSRDQGIQYTLEVFYLKENPTYNALSCTWGCPFAEFSFEISDDASAAEQGHECYVSTCKISVTCNGRRVLIPRNLNEGLQEMSQACAVNSTE